jgi:hypothetical protein
MEKTMSEQAAHKLLPAYSESVNTGLFDDFV